MYEEMIENAETQTAEEVVEKTYTQEEFDKGIQKRLARQEAKLRREYEEKYSQYEEAERVLNAGLGTSGIAEATEKMREFYEGKGIEIPKYQKAYSDEDMQVLADHEARKIIDYGMDAVIEEVDSMSGKGLDNLTPKEKLVYSQLNEYRQSEETRSELAKIGISTEALQDKEFIEFANDLNPALSAAEKYQLYQKYKPKEQIETIGSMRQSGIKDTGVKEFYTREEALKFTKADFDKNPALFKAVEKSMLKW